MVLIHGDTGNQGIPDMLIAGVYVDRRSDGEVVKNLHSALVFNRRTICEQPDAVLQFPADLVVVKPHAEAVILPAVPQTLGKKRRAGIPNDRICSFRCSISEPSE